MDCRSWIFPDFFNSYLNEEKFTLNANGTRGQSFPGFQIINSLVWLHLSFPVQVDK